jgi:hypothetical protein
VITLRCTPLGVASLLFCSSPRNSTCASSSFESQLSRVAVAVVTLPVMFAELQYQLSYVQSYIVLFSSQIQFASAVYMLLSSFLVILRLRCVGFDFNARVVSVRSCLLSPSSTCMGIDPTCPSFASCSPHLPLL